MREVNLAKKNVRQANRGIGRVKFHDWSIRIHERILNRFTLLVPYTVMHKDGEVENDTYSIVL
jgi:hypothetical protein